ncbi:hypothetical protein KIN20_031795 [Parelaphostrongylus tenuis]|uniref:Uncharacterized protein n=1 Tax=Parelaphostrongylus tenuis TaxID=148309 RepID=A0AAD5WI01_PARTN|nr:hypothetical protein KIN20_031795 [Parelaphostrongylus tenuis]
MLPDEITDKDEKVSIFGSESDDSLDDLLPSPMNEEHEFASGLVFPTIHASESSDDEFDLKVPTKHGPHEGERQKHDQADRGTLQEVTKSESASMSERRRYGPPQSFDNEFELLQ